MTDKMALFVDPEDVEHAILELRQIAGVKVRLETKEVAPPQSKDHPQYSMTFGELAPIIISVTGVLSSLLALATAIVQLRSQQKAKASNDSSPMIIVIRQQKITVNGSTTVDELHAGICEALNQTAKGLLED